MPPFFELTGNVNAPADGSGDSLDKIRTRVSLSPASWACLLCCALILLAMGGRPAHAQSEYPEGDRQNVFHVVSKHNEMTLTERFARVVELENRITRVDGFDPEILSVKALSPRQIRLQAVSTGVTTLILVDEFEETYEIEVFVEGDVRHLQSYINRFFPDASVTAVKVKDSIVLRGVVSDPAHISQITEVAEEFYPNVINHMQFGSANQVRLQVRIMEAQRSRIRQLGFNWSLLTSNGYVSSNPGNIASPNDVSLNAGGGNTLTHGGNALSASSISFGLVNASSIFRGFLEALKQEGLLRILVETSVVADSGRPASLLSGGEFPILVPQALGTLSVEWREFGVKLEAVPIVLGNGQVLMEIAPEFSERDFANAATLNNTTIPAITTRRANTQVRMRFGQTLMIGGLIATRYTAETDKVPFLGELPGIGAAFRRVRYDENETELIILVTPEYVAPLDPHQVPEGGPGSFSDVPTDHELYWQGNIEVPNYGGPVPPQSAVEGGGEFCPPGMIAPPGMEESMMGPPLEGDGSLPPTGIITPSEKPMSPMYGPDSETMPYPVPAEESTQAVPLMPLPEQPSQKRPDTEQAAPPLPLSPPSRQRDETEGKSARTGQWMTTPGRSQVQLTSGLDEQEEYEVHNASHEEMNRPPSLIPPSERNEVRQAMEKRVSAPNP